ncbi:hypothetical protein SCMU_17750 [Sinomonas cyclohexanicum]|uniref:Uncharacterized protein n=1 Tax=Sinomonas cyclohexanicum TaxID=322009 RepID=A0ABN6FGT9_SINCY|nr:hypothetical protein SCMU_17750 [Corynebacterium cyclohexanicum]
MGAASSRPADGSPTAPAISARGTGSTCDGRKAGRLSCCVLSCCALSCRAPSWRALRVDALLPGGRGCSLTFTFIDRGFQLYNALRARHWAYCGSVAGVPVDGGTPYMWSVWDMTALKVSAFPIP